MEYRQLGRTGIRVSELCLGAMTFGREADDKASQAMLDRFLDAGGNFIDTADVYSQGLSEEITGRSLGARRHGVVLATKVRFPMGDAVNDVGASRRHIRDGIEASLRRLGTDWVDLYQIHCWDPRTPLEETLSTLDDIVREGKVRYIGASNYTGWQLAKALGLSALHEWEAFASLQPEYSLICRDIERELLPLCGVEGLAVLPWSPLAGGLLTGKYQEGQAPPGDSRGGSDEHGMSITYRMDDRTWRIVNAVVKVAGDTGKSPSQVALNWVLHRHAVTAPIVGARTIEQLDDNLGACGWRLDTEHRRVLGEASMFRKGYPYEFIDYSAASH
jgi:aryl-alcohol dehydrogenase-like predicted oxidoreductase